MFVYFYYFAYRLGKNEQWKITKYKRSIINKCQFFVFGANYSNQINCKHVDIVFNVDMLRFVFVPAIKLWFFKYDIQTDKNKLKKVDLLFLVNLKSAYKYLLT